jgi:hypothetical protein
MAMVVPQFVYLIFPILCTIFFFLDCLGYDREMIYDYAWWISIAYFSTDFLVELMRFDLIYIFHHSICLTLLFLKLIWKDQKLYSNFMHLGLTMEISNIFYNARPLFAKGSQASLVNDLFFVASWFTTRMFYSIPHTISLVLIDGVDGGYPTLIRIAIIGVVMLHLYWARLILRKVYRQLFGGSKKD